MIIAHQQVKPFVNNGSILKFFMCMPGTKGGNCCIERGSVSKARIKVPSSKGAGNAANGSGSS